MQKILKINLDESNIDFINRHTDDASGVEVQLLDFKDDLSLLSKIKAKISSIHVDLFSDEFKEKHKNFSHLSASKAQDLLFNALLEDKKHLYNIFDACQKYNAAVVMHAGYKLNYLGKEKEEEALKEILSWKEKFPKLKVCLENVGQMRKALPEEKIYLSYEIPALCKQLNYSCNKFMFFPLLDICHYFMENSHIIDSPRNSLRETINMYNSEFMVFHFNYGVGDCTGKRHSMNFEANKPLMEAIIKHIMVINPNAILVLEIYEDDYFGERPNMMTQLNMIKETELKILQ